MFISEAWLYQCDLETTLALLSSVYSYHLNSDDSFDPELPLYRSRAYGGTLILWRRSLDRFVTVMETTSSRILPFILDIPGLAITAHICVYLPQANLEKEILDQLSKLEEIVEKIEEKYNDIPIFIRGDANASIPVRTAKKRDVLFRFFCDRINLTSTLTNHKTYHHFVREGNSDSSIDLILHKNSTRDVVYICDEIKLN